MSLTINTYIKYTETICEASVQRITSKAFRIQWWLQSSQNYSFLSLYFISNWITTYLRVYMYVRLYCDPDLFTGAYIYKRCIKRALTTRGSYWGAVHSLMASVKLWDGEIISPGTISGYTVIIYYPCGYSWLNHTTIDRHRCHWCSTGIDQSELFKSMVVRLFCTSNERR